MCPASQRWLRRGSLRDSGRLKGRGAPDAVILEDGTHWYQALVIALEALFFAEDGCAVVGRRKETISYRDD